MIWLFNDQLKTSTFQARSIELGQKWQSLEESKRQEYEGKN